jgi:beta-glucosidase-like glycosyl hydrolase
MAGAGDTIPDDNPGRRRVRSASLVLAFVAAGLASPSVAASPDRAAGEPECPPPYREASRPIEARVDDLLARMTLEEKLGQMNMPCVYEERLGQDAAEKTEACRRFAAGTYEPGLGPGGGFFTLPNTILHLGSRQQAEYLNELQRIAREKTRLGIPLLESEEGTHGLMCSGATIFPEGPALGSTFDLELFHEIYTAAAREARAIGVHQLFTLVVEPDRDPRLGRNQEGYSEDPWYCARIAGTIVRAAQGDDVSSPDHVVSGLCHFPGQSEPVSGLERGAMEVSERRLRETFLPPWVAGIRDTGALGTMATYPAIDGVPVHASERILTHLLREELGFRGIVLSEGGGLSTLLYEGLAPSMREAGALALRAGVDVGISYEDGYMSAMAESVRSGAVPMALVDRAVRRILRQKLRLGLFESPYVDPARAERVSHTAQHQELALRAAREGIVLLRNENDLLPLRKGLKEIAVIGPNADDVRNQLGDYTAEVVLQHVVTVLEGIRSHVSPRTRVRYVRGCDVVGEATDEIAEAAAAARSAQVAVVVVGENEWQSPNRQGTSGEGFDSATLELPGRQEDLVRAVHSTGTPTVVVLVNGRPLAVRWIAAHVPALVEAWVPGERGGEAVADVLFGDHAPEGRLPITFPRHAGQLPVAYDFKPSKAYWLEHGWGKPYVDLDPTPLFEFGYGLTYTTFAYSNLRVTPEAIGPGGEVTVEVDVENTGRRDGREVVQLYLRDPVASVVVPVQRLRGFEKVALAPGERRTVTFTLGPEALRLLDAHLEWVVEPGVFEVAVGRSSRLIQLTGRFEVKDPTNLE